MKQLTIIKIGGNVIDNAENLLQFLVDFNALPGYKILVHGGGKIATEIGESLGVKANMIEGRRITDAETLRVVTMVYAGLINKNIVAQLQAKNCNAIGLTGADANIITAKQRPITKELAKNGVLKEINYGFVGDLNEHSISSATLNNLLEANLIPVLCAITHNGNGQLLNTNADTIASAIAIAMSPFYQTQLVYCFEKKGVLKDVNDNNTLISVIKAAEFETLKANGAVAGGMIPKLHNAFQAISKGVKAVYIGKADELNKLANETFGTKMLN